VHVLPTRYLAARQGSTHVNLSADDFVFGDVHVTAVHLSAHFLPAGHAVHVLPTRYWPAAQSVAVLPLHVLHDGQFVHVLPTRYLLAAQGSAHDVLSAETTFGNEHVTAVHLSGQFLPAGHAVHVVPTRYWPAAHLSAFISLPSHVLHGGQTMQLPSLM